METTEPATPLNDAQPGGAFYLGDKMAYLPLKPAKTYEEQVAILASRGVIVEDEAYAISVLAKVNYYRFTAYLLPYKIAPDRYSPVSFNNVYGIYSFDQMLRFIILHIIERVEVTFRTRVAYFHAHSYGPDGYLDSSHFYNNLRHNEFLTILDRAKVKNSDSLFVQHHVQNYGGILPIWVAVEICTLTTVSKLYANMPFPDQRKIAKEYGLSREHLGSWISSICELRNRCAHCMRLYDHTFTSAVRPKKGHPIDGRNLYLYNMIYVSRFLIGDDKYVWPQMKEFIRTVISQFDDIVDISRIGFPEDWHDAMS